MNAQPTKTLAISDINLASFLLASGFPLKQIQGTSPRVEFVFEVPEEALLRFYRGEDLVSARAFADAQRNLLGLARQRR